MPEYRAARKVDFRAAYWSRVGELAPFLSAEDGERATAVRGAPRIVRRHLVSEAGSCDARFTLEYADELAKRYALWSTRRKWDWPSRTMLFGASREHLELHRQITEGTWDFDVVMRRELEVVLHGHRIPGDEDLPERLRDAVVRVRLALIVGLNSDASLDFQHEWQVVAQYFDAASADLSALLARAGFAPLE